MQYSIIVPYHSNKTYLELCLNSLETTVPVDVEIIVVVNNSEPSETNVKLNEKRFRVIRINENIGYSKAINIGAREAKGRYLIFCDSDTVYLNKDWFSQLTTFYLSDKKIGIASSKLVNPNTGRIIDYGMALSKYNNVHPFMDRLLDFPLAMQNIKVQMACSANMIIERELFIQMGMMDIDLINYYQDNDLCLRLKDFKRECWVVSKSIVYHRGSSSNIKRDSYRADVKGYYLAKNFARMEFDIHNYLEINYEYCKEHYQLPQNGKYLLVDLSTIADGVWFYDIIRDSFSVYDIYEMKYSIRDVTHLSLIDLLNINILTTKVPIIYFVDRFIATTNNSLWTNMRNCESDIVIDRNANVVPFSQLSNN